MRSIALALPEVTERMSHGAICFFIGKRPVCYLHDNHRGDGRVSVWCPVRVGVREEMVAADPARFFAPTPSTRGVFASWLGVFLDEPVLTRTDWDELARIVEGAYRMAAPRRLVERLDAR